MTNIIGSSACGFRKDLKANTAASEPTDANHLVKSYF
jgi:hypothetical protein